MYQETKGDGKVNYTNKINFDHSRVTFSVGYKFNNIGDFFQKPMKKSIKENLKKEVFKNTLNYEFNESKVTDENKEKLELLVEKINNNPNGKLEIIGHTDNSGTKEYNQKLSEKRAMAIDYIIIKKLSQQNIEKIVRGEGEMSPIASNDTEEGRSQNRRVEIKFQNK